MTDSRKWLLEAPPEGCDGEYSVFEVVGNEVVLRYMAQSKVLAGELITALEWMDSFKAGQLGIPQPPKPRGRPKKVVAKTPVRKKT